MGCINKLRFRVTKQSELWSRGVIVFAGYCNSLPAHSSKKCTFSIAGTSCQWETYMICCKLCVARVFGVKKIGSKTILETQP